MRERDHLEDVGGGIILKWIFKEGSGGTWTELMWLRIGTVGGFHKIRGTP
jgi:hypothetical protein